MTYYRARLARIHASGFTQYARAAGRLLIDELTEERGLVLDLGCGAGDLVDAVVPAGFEYVGVDLSPDMLALARRRYPGQRFEQGSAFDLPDTGKAMAIVAVGEVVNYAVDPRAGVAGLTGWLRACRERLAPGGVLLVDVAGPMRAGPDPVTQVINSEGYRLEVTVLTDPARRVLRRTIRIEDASGSETETHELRLIDPLDVMAALNAAGFAASPLDRYGPDLPFPRGWYGFLARAILDT